MWYLEFLRMRRALTVYALILLGIALALVVGLQLGHVAVGNSVSFGPGGPSDVGFVYVTGGHETKRVAAKSLEFPLVWLVGVAGFLAIFFTAILGPSLNAESEHLDYVFTKPISRARLGASYVLVDVAGLLAAFLVGLVIAVIPLASIGILRFLFVDSAALPTFVLLLGMAFMWYGEKQAATGWYQGSGGKAGVVSIVVFSILSALAAVDLGPSFHATIIALNFLNPLAYLHSLTSQGGTVNEHTLLPVSMAWQIVLTWSIGVVCCAIAVAGWRRVEA
jgi:hypothetical protein